MSFDAVKFRSWGLRGCYMTTVAGFLHTRVSQIEVLHVQSTTTARGALLGANPSLWSRAGSNYAGQWSWV